MSRKRKNNRTYTNNNSRRRRTRINKYISSLNNKTMEKVEITKECLMNKIRWKIKMKFKDLRENNRLRLLMKPSLNYLL